MVAGEWDADDAPSSIEPEIFDRRVTAFVRWWLRGPPPNPKGLSPRDARIIRLYTRLGKTIDAIGQDVGLGPSQVWRVLTENGVDTTRLPVCDTFAQLAGRDASTVADWRSGRRRIPSYVWRFLNALCALAEVGGRDAVLYAIMDAGAPPMVDAERSRALGLRA